MNILCLNTDVLLIIFSKLSTKDLLSAARASDVFMDILPLCHVPHVAFSPSLIDRDGMSPEDLEFVLQQVGNSVQSIQCWGNGCEEATRYTSSIAAHCRNLRKLELRHFTLDSLTILKDTFKKLHSLYLSFSDLEDNMQCLFPDPLPNMKYLRLKNCEFDLDCSGINTPNLEKVKFKYTNLVNFDKFCGQCPKLKELFLTHCSVEHSEFLKAVDLLPNVEYFMMKSDINDDLTSLYKLRSLREVRLAGEDIIVDSFLTRMAKVDQLTALSLNETIIGVDTIKALAKTKNLKQFFVSYADQFGNLQVKAMYDNNFEEIRMYAISADAAVLKELAVKSSNLKIFDVNGMGFKKKTYDEIKAAKPHVNVIVPFNAA